MRDGGVLFFAFCLIAGGLVGVGVSLFLGYSFIPQHWIYGILAAAFLALFIWSMLVGIRLWRGDPRGDRWAKILYAFQIPVLTVPGLSYEYYTGLSFKALLGQTDSNVAFNFGAGAELYLDTGITGVVVGANFFALAAFLYLWRSGPVSETGASH